MERSVDEDMRSNNTIQKCIRLVLDNEEEWTSQGLFRHAKKSKLTMLVNYAEISDIFSLQPLRQLSDALRSAIKEKHRINPLANGTVPELCEFLLIIK